MDFMNSEILQRSMLFHGLHEEDISAALGFLRAEEKKVRRALYLSSAESCLPCVGNEYYGR